MGNPGEQEKADSNQRTGSKLEEAELKKVVRGPACSEKPTRPCRAPAEQVTSHIWSK